MRKFSAQMLFAGGCLMLSIQSARGTSIGVNFEGGGNGPGPISLLSTDSAGVVPQTNWNNESGNSGTAITNLVDSAGATQSGVTLAYGGGGGTYSVGQASPVGGDQELNDGFIYGSSTITVTGVPYARYDVYVYELNDAAGRPETTSLTGAAYGTETYFGQAASPQDPDHVSGVANTYLYTQSTDTTGAGTPNGDYVEFTGVSDASFTLTNSAPGNGYLNGFQIVPDNTPEPASATLIGLSSLGLLMRRRRR